MMLPAVSTDPRLHNNSRRGAWTKVSGNIRRDLHLKAFPDSGFPRTEIRAPAMALSELSAGP